MSVGSSVCHYLLAPESAGHTHKHTHTNTHTHTHTHTAGEKDTDCSVCSLDIVHI